MPALVRRGEAVMFVLPQIAIFTGMILWWRAGGWSGGVTPRHFAVLLLPPAGVLASAAVKRWRDARIRRRVVGAQGKLCTHCGYDLSGLPDAGVCPECGREYRIDDTRAAWRTWRFLPGNSDQ